MKPNMQLLMDSGGGAFVFHITTNSTGYNLRSLALNAGWDTVSKVFAIIDGSVILTALSVSGSFPAGVDLMVSASAGITGAAGIGGNRSAGNTQGLSGNAGGTALVVSVPVTITNNGQIAGGGGGGAGGAGSRGTNGTFLSSGAGGNGAALGSAAVSGGTGETGSGGTYAGNGGDGGGLASAGSNSTSSYGWDDSAGYVTNVGSNGGGAGAAVVGNSNITWLATGTRTGAIT